MCKSFYIHTSAQKSLSGSITPRWECCSGRWDSQVLQRQTLGLLGEWRYVQRKPVWSLATTLGFGNKSVSPDRIHWKVWNQSSLGRLQEEPQRRHPPTEDTQDLHRNISIFFKNSDTLFLCIPSVIWNDINMVCFVREETRSVETHVQFVGIQTLLFIIRWVNIFNDCDGLTTY